MLKDREKVNLSNLDGGALAEMFEAKLPQVLENIKDPNTKPDAMRQITITLKIKPTKSRKEADLTYGIACKLAAPIERATTVYLGNDANGELALKEYPQNLELEEALEEAKARAMKALAAPEAEAPADGGKVVNIGERS